MRACDLIALIEACYRVDRSEQAWLEGCAEAARPFLDRGLGYLALTYDLWKTGEDMFPARVLADAARFKEGAPNILRIFLLELLSAWKRRTTWFANEKAFPSAIQDGVSSPDHQMLESFMAVGVDLDDRGCVLAGAVSHPELRLQQNVWIRLAAHLGAGYGLRRTLERLRTSPRTLLERAPTKTERRSPDECLPPRRILVSPHRILVEMPQADGRGFVIAPDNRSRRHLASALSSRERQAMALLALGQTNKEIAFALGISASTVGVLLYRAARKLKTTSRSELLAQAKALELVAEERAAS